MVNQLLPLSLSASWSPGENLFLHTLSIMRYALNLKCHEPWTETSETSETVSQRTRFGSFELLILGILGQ